MRMPRRPYRVLFVCMGNICRSPAAEGVLNSLLESEGLGKEIECDSAGTIRYHAGNRADARMRRAAESRGINLESIARPVLKSDFEEFDLILTMDEENYSDVTRLERKAKGSAKVARFCEYLSVHDDAEVPDPYYGGDDGFDYVLDLLEDGCSELLRTLKNA